MFIVDKAHELIRIDSNKMDNENNFNFKFPVHKIPSSTMVSVVDFESEYPGSILAKMKVFFSNTMTSNFFNDDLTDNRVTYVPADLKILLIYH